MSEYTEQAEKFLKETGTKFYIKYVDYKPYFQDDKESRAIFRFTFRRNGKTFSGKFGQSIAEGMNEPTAYDVLACIEKHDVGDFENFCSEYGYSNDGRKAEKTYRQVIRQFKSVNRIFGDVMEKLQNIQ